MYRLHTEDTPLTSLAIAASDVVKAGCTILQAVGYWHGKQDCRRLWTRCGSTSTLGKQFRIYNNITYYCKEDTMNNVQVKSMLTSAVIETAPHCAWSDGTVIVAGYGRNECEPGFYAESRNVRAELARILESLDTSPTLSEELREDPSCDYSEELDTIDALNSITIGGYWIIDQGLYLVKHNSELDRALQGGV